MSTRISRDNVYWLSEDIDVLAGMGLTLEQTEDVFLVSYPEGAVRETIPGPEGLCIVFFTYHYERRQMTERYNPHNGAYALTLKPARFAQ